MDAKKGQLNLLEKTRKPIEWGARGLKEVEKIPKGLLLRSALMIIPLVVLGDIAYNQLVKPKDIGVLDIVVQMVIVMSGMLEVYYMPEIKGLDKAVIGRKRETAEKKVVEEVLAVYSVLMTISYYIFWLLMYIRLGVASEKMLVLKEMLILTVESFIVNTLWVGYLKKYVRGVIELEKVNLEEKELRELSKVLEGRSR